MRSYTQRCALLSVLALLGCAQPEVPHDKFYRLTAAQPSPRAYATPPLDATLTVHQFVATGVIGDRALVYASADAPNQLQQYHYHQWSSPPTHMLQDFAVACLRAGNLARRTVTPELRAKADYALTGELRRLEQIRGESPRVALELEIALRRARDDELLWLQIYRAENPTADESVSSAVTALDQAFHGICAKLVTDLAEEAPRKQRTRP